MDCAVCRLDGSSEQLNDMVRVPNTPSSQHRYPSLPPGSMKPRSHPAGLPSSCSHRYKRTRSTSMRSSAYTLGSSTSLRRILNQSTLRASQVWSTPQRPTSPPHSHLRGTREGPGGRSVQHPKEFMTSDSLPNPQKPVLPPTPSGYSSCATSSPPHAPI